MIRSTFHATAALSAALVAHAPAALSYVGPGAGLGMITSLFAMVLAVIATIVGLVLWPIRKLSRRKKPAASETAPPKTENGA